MSSGKETPRQKMIGMMYLVLTALLALNVSKEILQGFVMVDESIGKSKVILDENNQRVQKAFEDYVNDGNYEAKPYLLKSVETQKSIRIVDAYIDSMKVFKFGGASVKDGEGVKNVAEVLKQFPDQKISVVVSAMGKTTNSLERLAKAYFYKTEDAEAILEEVKKYHFDICTELFSLNSHPIFIDIENTFVELYWAIEDEPTQGFNFEYDQIVSMGEIISTKIVSAYLNEIGIQSKWIDVRGLIQN